ncbi:DNA polymerase III subunit beta [Ponticaulis sp.]|uniref:DNA polymerase III subunit beta n=1 Tax=Ponticaulis sp. TaxID=2020902 RepID=UPI000B762729|nr:DNA polymerase III subunit beta [Ponticaulis sp.]MAI89262.1 DNA polymerase III subunit beta [Ponticaulis sp.]OUY01252.1 MAG: DNA polymerase III subunit beta [Hyphomonadaceae bacterium TMED5]|tara:strand:+ start:4165 stop:5283 length:1119 start_codon:yes stop_codon:yes gene_type:complete
MKLTIDRSDLLRALSHVQSVVERRNTIPILSNVLLAAGSGSLTLTATDLDIEAVDAADAHVDQEGALTAPAQTLFDVVRKLPETAEVQLEYMPDNQRLSIQAGRSRFALPTLPAADFQTMVRDEGAVSFSLDVNDLKRLIDKTRFAISTEETRYYLNGVYLHIHKGEDGSKLRAVATDGHRLALSEIDAPQGSDSLAGVIIPRKAVSEIRRLIDGYDGVIEVSASEAKIVFTAGRAVLTTKLIDGSFPDYARVIPQNNEQTLKAGNVALEKAVDRVATVSAERSRSVKMSLEADKVVLTVNHAETGHGVEEVEGEYGGEPMEIGFNARYLLDVFQQVDGDEILFDFNDPASPALVRDPADPASRYVLMPLRV